MMTLLNHGRRIMFLFKAIPSRVLEYILEFGLGHASQKNSYYVHILSVKLKSSLNFNTI